MRIRQIWDSQGFGCDGREDIVEGQVEEEGLLRLALLDQLDRLAGEAVTEGGLAFGLVVCGDLVGEGESFVPVDAVDTFAPFGTRADEVLLLVWQPKHLAEKRADHWI